MDIASAAIKEPESQGVRQYESRVTHLNIIFVVLFFSASFGLIVLLLQIKPLVVLAQRSNVETLTLAFLFVFYVYLLLISMRGAWGALRNFYFHFFGSEESKQRYLERRTRGEPITVALNMCVRRKEIAECSAFEIPITDSAGSMGKLRFDGARLTYLANHNRGCNSLFPFVVEQINRFRVRNPGEPPLEIVEWSKIDDEETEKFLAIAEFARRLERHLERGPLWPFVLLSPEQLRTLGGQLSKLCSSLRSEALLPDWEYGGEHKLPIIPEPLGIVSLNRTEKRVDPLASMTSVLIAVGFSLGILLFLVWRTPWVPGK